ncbi:MAG: DUF4167 domain-containing protein [Pseudomonadota bacterium]
MRSSSKNRSRSKNGRKSLGNIVNRVFESAGPEGKVRGTPQQIIEKYSTLSRDAQTAGDRISAENFQQHAEHYIRMLADAQREMAPKSDATPVAQPVAPDLDAAVPLSQSDEQSVVTVADALATIDSSDVESDHLGLVETPESSVSLEPVEVTPAEPVQDSVQDSEPASEDSPKAAKPRSRTPRRRTTRSKEPASPATPDEVPAG